jgi:Rod binding domain-containing protein
MTESGKINSTILPTRGIGVDKPTKIENLPANRHLVPTEYKNIAAGMEKQFAEHMIAQMNSTVGGEEKNSAEAYYEGLMDSERAQKMVETNGGLGLQDMILDQVYPRRMRNETSFKAYQNQNVNENAIRINRERTQEGSHE